MDKYIGQVKCEVDGQVGNLFYFTDCPNKAVESQQGEFRRIRNREGVEILAVHVVTLSPEEGALFNALLMLDKVNDCNQIESLIKLFFENGYNAGRASTAKKGRRK